MPEMERVVINHPGPTPDVIALGQARSREVKQRHKAARVDRAVRLRKQGYGLNVIARAIDVTPETISKYLREAGCD